MGPAEISKAEATTATSTCVESQTTSIKFRNVRDIQEFLSLPRNSTSSITEIEMNRLGVLFFSPTRILKRTPKVEKLSFDLCRNFCQNSFSPLSADDLSNLKQINFYRTKISGEDLRQLFQRAKSLEKTSVYECIIINVENTADTLEENSLPNLKMLDFADSKITFSFLQEVLMAANNIESLDIQWCTDIQFGEMSSLAKESLPRLKTAFINSTNMNAADLAALLAAAPNLEIIYFHYHRHLTKTEVDDIMKDYPNLKVKLV